MRRTDRKRRHLRVKRKIKGTPERPRLCVYRSNRYIYAILVDDTKDRVIASVSNLTQELRKHKNETKGKIEISKEVGKLLAKRVLKLGVKKVCFDRGGYLYHGRVKALAEGAREGGLVF